MDEEFQCRLGYYFVSDLWKASASYLSFISNSGDIAYTSRMPSQDDSSWYTTLNCSHHGRGYDKGPMHVDIIQAVSRMEQTRILTE
ncbi:hypothetical protein LTR96_011240 [Exophiala xenobiotica]|nr:hypothetical protein LTR96_011240 [Exophiala xenobiotica]